MKSYTPICPDNPRTNPMLIGNDPEGYARAPAPAVGAQTTTKLSDLTRGQLNDMVVESGKHEGYFKPINSAKSVAASDPTKQ